MAEIVRRRSFGAVLPLGRQASISGSRPIQCASDSIALSSFREGQNARHHNRFKCEQALKAAATPLVETVWKLALFKGKQDNPPRKLNTSILTLTWATFCGSQGR